MSQARWQVQAIRAAPRAPVAIHLYLTGLIFQYSEICVKSETREFRLEIRGQVRIAAGSLLGVLKT